MLEYIARKCHEFYSNNFHFERSLLDQEWDSIYSRSHQEMFKIVGSSVNSSHTSIMSYVIGQEGMMEYCRKHILRDVKPIPEYARAILTKYIPYSFNNTHENNVFDFGSKQEKYKKVESALKKAEFGVVMVMLQFGEYLGDNYDSFATKHLIKLVVENYTNEADQVLKALLDVGVDIDSYMINAAGDGILYSNLGYSINSKCQGFFNFLLANNVDVKHEREEVKGLKYVSMSPMHSAVKKGLVWAVKGLLEAGSDPQEIECGDWIPLYTAFQHINENTIEILDMLLKAMSELPEDAVDRDKFHKAFYSALKNSKLQTEHLELLFKYFPNLYEESQIIGQGAISLEIPKDKYNGQWPKGNFMMESREDHVLIRCFPKSSYNPMDVAISSDNAVAVGFFLDRGFYNLNERYFTDSSSEDQLYYEYPLHGAVHYHSLKTVRLLLERGADMYLEAHEVLPLERVFHIGLNNFDSNDAIEIIKCFEDMGYDIRNVKFHERTLLLAATESGCHIKTVGYIAVRSDIDAQNYKGETALHFAAISCDANKLQYLLSKGARPDIHNHQGKTPIHYAASADSSISEKVMSIIILLSFGARISDNDTDREVFLHIFRENVDQNANTNDYIELFFKCEKVFSEIKPEEGYVSLFRDSNAEFNLDNYNARIDALEKAFTGDISDGVVYYYY